MKDRYIVPRYTLTKIPQDIKISSNTYTALKLDNICLFASLNNHNSYLQKFVSNDFKFDVVDYAERLDLLKLNIVSPFAKLRTMDFSSVFTQLKGKYMPRSIIAFDIIFVGSKKIIKQNVNNELRNIIEKVNKPDVINFYNMYFDVFPQAKQFVNNLNEFTQVRRDLQILEQFKEPFAFHFDTNVNGFYDSYNNTLLINGSSIHDIPLKKNSNIVLKNQNRAEENGRYHVSKLNKKQTLLSKLIIESKQVSSNEFQAGYKCTDPNIKSKPLCESLFLPNGERKRVRTYWDKPCEKHIECPFYQKNKNYPNYRGGCIDGTCEMPIGINNISFRKYDKSQQPLCHQCIDPLAGGKCCPDQQQNNILYPTLKSPDYAFELDFFERMRITKRQQN
jgi:hypothetical protein